MSVDYYTYSVRFDKRRNLYIAEKQPVYSDGRRGKVEEIGAHITREAAESKTHLESQTDDKIFGNHSSSD